MARPARSRLTGQGQVSIPADIRRKLGIAPGSVVEWEVDGERVFVRRSGRHTFEEMHRRLFPKPPRPRTVDEMDDAIRSLVVKRHARR